MDRNGKIWIEIDKNGSMWIERDRNGNIVSQEIILSSND